MKFFQATKDESSKIANDGHDGGAFGDIGAAGARQCECAVHTISYNVHHTRCYTQCVHTGKVLCSTEYAHMLVVCPFKVADTLYVYVFVCVRASSLD